MVGRRGRRPEGWKGWNSFFEVVGRRSREVTWWEPVCAAALEYARSCQKSSGVVSKEGIEVLDCAWSVVRYVWVD